MAWTQQPTIYACHLSVAKRASGHKKNRRTDRKTNEFVFSAGLRFFPVRFAHSRASFAGLPGSWERRFCFSLRLLLSRRQTGFSASLLTQKRSVSFFVQFLFSDSIVQMKMV